MSGQLAIKVEHLSKDFRLYREKSKLLSDRILTYGRTNHYEIINVLKDISFEVKLGQMVGVIGKNGSGKTTLLRILAGILKPSSGKVTINGKITPLLQLGLGFNQDLSAIDNITMYGMILGLSKKEITKRIPDILEFAELEDFGNVAVRNYSSGMKARLAFSVALSVNPDVLLVDEILAVGDASFQKKSLGAFMNLKNNAKTIVLVSHSLDQVRRLCDSAILLHEGIIAESGDPSAVIRKYLELSYNLGQPPVTVPVSSSLGSDLFPQDSIFLKTSSGTSANRLNWRSKILIQNNSFVIKDKSILDLGSNNGSFIYSAIQSGAKFVEGIEARANMIDISQANLNYCKIDKAKYKLIKGDIFNILMNTTPKSFDTILCFGIMSKIISHADLIYRIVRLKPQYFIIDTEVSKTNDQIISLAIEDNKIDHNTIRGDSIVGIPSKGALEFLLGQYKVNYRYLDWNSFGITNWSDLEDYRSNTRISLIGTLSGEE